jgi:hypothetical protein
MRNRTQGYRFVSCEKVSRVCCPIFVSLMIVCATALGSQTAQPNAQSGQPTNNFPGIPKIFKGLDPRLKVSAVPLVFPHALPYVKATEPLYLSVQSVGQSGYSIVLAVVDQPCEGQNWCTYGSIEGSANPIHISDLPAIPVQLANGVQALYTKSVCDAFCTQAYISWKQNGYYYSIGIKAGKKRQLIEAANSAISTKPIRFENP